MDQSLVHTNFSLPGQTNFYRGKVRDVYTINNEILVMVATNRISAFDVILPKGIPYKGQVLNQVAGKFLEATQDIVPNWVLSQPDPNVTIGRKCVPYKIEMVIRGYLSGHAWREYKAGKRLICGVSMPDGMKESDPFPEPIITPATKAEKEHDEDISAEEIILRGIVPEKEYLQLEHYTRKLFERGTEIAASKGLILVDTKYEFGKAGDEIILIDEIHTPDSSRYFYSDGYKERQKQGVHQKQLSKEFVRKWLMQHGFQGLEGQAMPEMPDDFVQTVSNRYIELFEQITGKTFQKQQDENIHNRVEANITRSLNELATGL